MEGSPGRASQHLGTAGSSRIVHIPPLISRLPTLLPSAPQRSWGLFSPLPSPGLAEGAYAPVPEKAEDGMETDLGLQSDVGKHALAKK